MSRIKGGKIKPVPVKMSCSAIRYQWIIDTPAVLPIAEDVEKGIEEVPGQDAIGHDEITKNSPCKAENVAGFDAHLGRRHRKCSVQGQWKRAINA